MPCLSPLEYVTNFVTRLLNYFRLRMLKCLNAFCDSSNRGSASAGAVGGGGAAGRSSIEDPSGDLLLNCPPGGAGAGTGLGGLSPGCVPLVPDPIVVRGAGNITV